MIYSHHGELWSCKKIQPRFWDGLQRLQGVELDRAWTLKDWIQVSHTPDVLDVQYLSSFVVRSQNKTLGA